MTIYESPDIYPVLRKSRAYYEAIRVKREKYERTVTVILYVCAFVVGMVVEKVLSAL